MRVAHFDCFSGISGDMTLGALVDAGVDAEAIQAGIASLGLPIKIEVGKDPQGRLRRHLRAASRPPTNTSIAICPTSKRSSTAARLTAQQRDLALRIFRRLAEAEAAVHGMPLEKVHFHEVGALDSIADIAGVGRRPRSARRRALHQPAGADRQRARCKCAHGIMPVPAPGDGRAAQGRAARQRRRSRPS